MAICVNTGVIGNGAFILCLSLSAPGLNPGPGKKVEVLSGALNLADGD